MESDPKWIHHLHSPEAWIALIVGGAEILFHEPSVRFALLLMLALGIAFAALFRILRKDREADFSGLHLTAAPYRCTSLISPSRFPSESRKNVIHKS